MKPLNIVTSTTGNIELYFNIVIKLKNTFAVYSDQCLAKRKLVAGIYSTVGSSFLCLQRRVGW